MTTALEIAAQIKSQKKTVAETVQEHIARIEKINSSLNAVVETRFGTALQEAEEKDKILQKMSAEDRQKLPPFFGVPWTCKEMISIQGMKSTMGSIHHKDQVMNSDATVVKRIKDAGAILLGTTNVPEVGFWFECDNVVYGATKNPYDLKRTPGGSSGGEGAIIGAGASPFGIGSDIGGSIRTPSAFCGVFGHKPSDRVVPLTGHYPIYQDNASEITGAKYPFTVLGPMARSASDLEALFRLMVGPDEYDSNIKKDFMFQNPPENCESMKIYYLSSPVIHATTETEPDISQAILHAGRYLRELGANVQELEEKIFLRAMDLWAARTWSIEGKEFTSYLADDHPLQFSKEFFNLIRGHRKYTLPSLLTGVVDRYLSDRSELETNLQRLAQLKERLTLLLGKNGVLLMPVHPRKAPLLNSTYTRPFDFVFAGIINALGFPATAVPMGLSSEGLPISLQIVAAEDQDHLCLGVARMLETGFGGWHSPRSPL